MLNNFFSPRSICVIGASRDRKKLGFLVYENIRKYGYKGKLFGVNIKGGKIGADKLYETVGDIPGSVDLAVMVVPAAVVPEVIRECGEIGINSAIIISAGFSEIGAKGKKLEAEIADLAGKYGMRILGPNCLGIIDSWSKMNASFAQTMPDKMKISLVSQSGAICTAILDWANANEIGFSRFISLGNKLDIDENDILKFLALDEKTNVVLGYLESIRDGCKFMEEATKLSSRKPLILVKAGRTTAGAKAISSHTGSIAGSDLVMDAALKQSGVIRAESLEELFDLAKIFAFSPEMKGNRVAVISNAGGPAVMLADAIGKSRLKLAKLSEKTRKVLAENLPPEASVHNPIDVIGDARSDRYETALDEVLKDENVDGAVVVLTPQVMTEIEKTAEIIICAKKHGKPIAACFMGGEKIQAGKELLEEHEIPFYEFPEQAVKALEALYEYCKFRNQHKLCHSDRHYASGRRRNPLTMGAENDCNGNKGKGFFNSSLREVARNDNARGIIQNALRTKTKIITENSFDIFDRYGIQTVKRAYGLDLDDLKKEAEKMGFPVVLKTAAEGVLHRTEIGGVVTGIRNEAELQRAYFSIRDRVRKAGFKNSGKVDIFKQEDKGIEIFLGAKKDASFGPLIIFGMGGVFVEAMGDFAYRIAPVSHSQALKMIGEIKSQKVLNGFRGQPEVNRDLIASAIVGLSQLMLDFPEIKEIDINPLMATDKKCVAVDGKIILDLETSSVLELVK